MTFGVNTDAVVAEEQIKCFNECGYRELDTARMYAHGETEQLLGPILADCLEGFFISTKANAFKGYDESLNPTNLKLQIKTSLDALRLHKVDIFYLHAPDIDTPIEETLLAVQEIFEQGLFREFGLSNYASWEVVYIHGYCKLRGWVLPTVYQGMYNAITRDVERELFPALKKLNMRFYCYNPLCGGLLTGKHDFSNPDGSEGTRFDKKGDNWLRYANRYWKKEYFDALQEIGGACTKEDISVADASLRWLVHHSALRETAGDAIIIGASTLDHLRANISSCEQGPLPVSVVAAFDAGWTIARPVCEKYFRP